jgi:hypothetical protein
MPDRNQHVDRPTRPPYFWLSVSAVGVAVVILGVRVIALPASSMQPFAIAALVAVGVTGAIVAAYARAVTRRMRAAARSFPNAVLIPVLVGTATAVATNWLATHLDDPSLRLNASTSATIAIDSVGLHIVRSPVGPHGSVAASAVRLGPLGRTVIGIRERDAIVLEITVDAATAPLALVPVRLRGNPFRALGDEELIEVVARIEDALAGRAIRPGWRY